MKLIFKTPSRNCPYRKYNGAEVRIVGDYGKRRVRRLSNRRATEYAVYFVGHAKLGIALPDELVIVP